MKKLESKLGRFAIPNLTFYIMAFIVCGFFINVADETIYANYLALDFTKIMQGEVWRLVSYLLYDSHKFDVLGILFFMFSILFYSFIGKGLEAIWGKFWYNAYIFGGLFFNFIGSLIVYLITGQTISQGFGPILSTMFLAFAFLFPDFKINLWMIIPIKMKWLGILYGVISVINIFINFIIGGVLGIGLGVQGILSILNFVFFYLITRDRQKNLNSMLKRFGDVVQKAVRNQEVSDNVVKMKPRKIMDDSSSEVKKAYHRCCVCGKTELDDPNLEFRYCSKCEGEHEYCSEHLKNHTHIK